MRPRWGVSALLCALILWALLLDTGFVRHRALAGPLAIALALVNAIADGTILVDTFATLLRVAAGVAFGGAVGTAIGMLLGAGGECTRPVEPALDFARAIPPALVLPVLLLAFGYGDLTRIAVIAWATTFVMSFHVAVSIRRGRPERARVFFHLRATLAQRLRWLYAREAVPGMLSGMRHSVSVALVVAVVTEMLIGAPQGLGARAVSAQIAYDAPMLYGVMAVVGCVGFSLSRAIMLLEKRTSDTLT